MRASMLCTVVKRRIDVQACLARRGSRQLLPSTQCQVHARQVASWTPALLRPLRAHGSADTYGSLCEEGERHLDRRVWADEGVREGCRRRDVEARKDATPCLLAWLARPPSASNGNGGRWLALALVDLRPHGQSQAWAGHRESFSRLGPLPPARALLAPAPPILPPGQAEPR